MKHENKMYLFIIGLIPGSSMWGLNLGLCSVNMAEAAGESVPGATMAEIYISTALRVTAGKLKFMAVSLYINSVLLYVYFAY